MTGLAPRIGPEIAALLADPATLGELVREHGSPVNIVLPDVFAANVTAFGATLDARDVPHRICFAHKANQARAFVDTALRTGIGIDVASGGELAQALRAGFPPGRIEATGPKGETFLEKLCAYGGLTVNVDNLWELETIARLAPARVPVLLRLSAGRRLSRFGLAPADFPAAFEVVAGSERLDLAGIAFHLDTADLAERVAAVTVALELVENAYAHGLSPKVIDVGGGFRQVHLDDPDGADAYVQRLREGLAGQGPSLAWGGYTFGYRVGRDGAVRGTPVFHRYTGAEPGTTMLGDLLDATLGDGRTVAESVRENLLELWIEPGKALVDQAGITVATVQFTRRAADGSLLVVLDLSRDMVTPADQELMVDPVLIHNGQPDEGCEAFLAGNLCLERDMISNHLVRLPRLPQPGDLMVFVNTAAYQMDLSASGALMHPRPPKVAATRRGGVFQWRADGGDTCSTSTSAS
ncbi:alanine racemase [Actinoplanes sp. HUAS TT8]|uniref:alanine racemase n=1 Tax=Actinoplanes sp. HUAS TT8 TaxID=3447453 RepID=UPI003F51B92B